MHDDSRSPFAETSRAVATALGVIIAGLIFASQAVGAPPSVYVSDVDNGVAPVGPIEIPAGSATTVFLFIDGGTGASFGIRCAQGSGDEVCGFDLVLEGQNGLNITDFTPQASIVFNLAGDTLGVVGGDTWLGTLGPQNLGEITVQGSENGTLDLLASKSVNAGLGLESVGAQTLLTVPEPGATLGLLCGGVLLAGLARRRTRRPRRIQRTALLLATSISVGVSSLPAHAQVSDDCGDVVVDGVIDIQDLDTLLQFLAGDPAAPDLQNDAQLLARCDVSADGFCQIDDYVRIRRYMLDLTGGMNETCPLTGSTYPPVVLPPPTVDQASPISSDRASVVLSGTADPSDIIRVRGSSILPSDTTQSDGTWQIEIPLEPGQANLLEVYRDHGAGQVSEPVPVTVNQSPAVGSAMIQGRVFNAADGETIAGALVECGGVDYFADSLGIFEIPDLPEGLTVLRVEAPGFVPALVLDDAGTALFDEDRATSSNHPLTVALTPRNPAVTIGAGGGTVTAPSGVELVVPAGSLPGDVPISLTDLDSTVGKHFGALPVVDIGPGSIAFDPPALLRIPAGQIDPGTFIDFDQVDHLNQSVEPIVGTVSVDGYIEVPIASTNGDDVRRRFRMVPTERFVFLPDWLDNFFFEDKFSQAYTWPLSAPCRGSLPFFPWKLRANGIPDEFISPVPTYFYDPVLMAALEDEQTLLGVALHQHPSSVAGETILIPYGYIAVVDLTVEYEPRAVTVMVASWVEGSTEFNNKPIGVLTYFVATDQQIETVRIVPNKKCNIRPEAAAWADPHLIRFDHVGEALPLSSGDGRYDFQASGEFILFESTEDDMVVQARMQPANNSATVTRAVAMDVDGDRLSIYSNAVLDVRIEGVPTPLAVGVPIALPGGGELERETTGAGKDSVWVRWSDDSEVHVAEWTSTIGGSYLDVFPNLDASRFARVRGLLGNANGVLGDDFNLRDGTPANPAEKHTTYADSWRISQAESLFDYVPPEDTSTYNGTPTVDDYTCDGLDPAVQAAAEADCIAVGVTTDPWLCDCALDVAVMGTDAAGAAARALIEVPPNGVRIAVPGDANIFGAGLGSVPDFGGGGGNGSLPVEFTLPAGTSRYLRVLDSAGAVSFSVTGDPVSPDGVASSLQVWGEWGGLPGPIVSRTGITMGVFLDAASRPAVTPPAYECGDATGEFMTPEIGQVFCLGDGLTGFSEPLFAHVPDAATRLFLGFADRVSMGAPLVTLPEPSDSTPYHIGNDPGGSGLFALAPEPLGIVWESTLFDAPYPESFDTARLLIDIAATDFQFNEVLLNGAQVGFLPVYWDVNQWLSVILSFDPRLLEESGNRITIRADSEFLEGYEGYEDDFMIQNLRVEVSPLDLPPGGYSDNSGIHEFIIDAAP